MFRSVLPRVQPWRLLVGSLGAASARCLPAVSQTTCAAVAPNLNLQQVATFKVKPQPKLRCQHCYFIRIDGRMCVLCTKHPRHKQMEKMDVNLMW